MIAQLCQVLEIRKPTPQAEPLLSGAFVSWWARRQQTHVLGGDRHHFENKTGVTEGREASFTSDDGGSPLMKRNLNKTWKKMLRKWARDMLEGATYQEEESGKEKIVKQKCAWQVQETARKWVWLEPREWGGEALRWGAGGSLDPGFTWAQMGAAGQSWAEQGCEGLTCERVTLATIWAIDKGGETDTRCLVRRFCSSLEDSGGGLV